MKGINPQLMERLSQRLFFVVNKADVKHVCEGAPYSSLYPHPYTGPNALCMATKQHFESSMATSLLRLDCCSFRSG